jgi:hypothetical protein
MLTGITLAGYIAEQIPTVQPRRLIVDQRVRFLVLAGVVQAAATLATPYGIEMYRYIIELARHPIMYAVTEWQPTHVDDTTGLEFFLSLGAAALVLGVGRRRRAPADILMVGVFGAMAVLAARNIGWWSLVCPPVLAAQLADLRLPLPARLAGSGSSQRPLLGGRVLGIAAAAFIVLSLPWVRSVNPMAAQTQRSVVAATYPTGAVDFLMNQHESANHLLGYQTWAPYLDWALSPRYQLMVDCAIEAHPLQVWQDYMLIDGGNVQWESLVDKYGVDVMLLSKADQPLIIGAVDQSPNWRVAYQDDTSVVYERA